MQTRVLEAVPAANSVLVGFSIANRQPDGSHRQRTVFQVMTVRDGRVSEIRGYPSRTEAAEHAGLTARPERMHVDAVVPILKCVEPARQLRLVRKAGLDPQVGLVFRWRRTDIWRGRLRHLRNLSV